MRKGMLQGVSALALALVSAVSAQAASLPGATQKAMAQIKLDPSVMNGLDADLNVPKAWLDGALALEYTLGSQPTAGRKGPPDPDLFPANNPVLRPPVAGKVGLWSKTDSTSYFKDYVVSPRLAEGR